ncbi:MULTISPECIES: DUF711 family protein [Streptococcus]|uniref:DUF711 family protein n=1 Tax=Streptococcus caledonicus TaxID=2614158 RepID=A0ABW0U9U2_9STRE
MDIRQVRETIEQKIYDKITTKAANLVSVGDEIAAKLGISIVNKHVSVTPIALIGAATDALDYFPLGIHLIELQDERWRDSL